MRFQQKTQHNSSWNKKVVHDVMEGAYEPAKNKKINSNTKVEFEKYEKYEKMPPKLLGKEIEKLEKAMLKYAKNLEFEKAAALRDEISEIKQRIFKK